MKRRAKYNAPGRNTIQRTSEFAETKPNFSILDPGHKCTMVRLEDVVFLYHPINVTTQLLLFCTEDTEQLPHCLTDGEPGCFICYNLPQFVTNMATYYSFLNKLKVFLESPVGTKVMGSETVLEISLEPGTELERH